MSPRTSSASRSCLIALLLSGTAMAGNLGFLKGSSVTNFTDDDVNLLMKNAAAVLNSDSAGAAGEWSNPKTGATGMAQVQGQFNMADGTPCKRLRVSHEVKGKHGGGTYTLCKDEQRGWLLNPQASPAPSKP